MIRSWEIIKELESDNSRLFKEGVLQKYLEEIDFQEGLAMCLDSLVTFGVKQVPESEIDGSGLSWVNFKDSAKLLIETAKIEAGPTDVWIHNARFNFIQEYYPWPCEVKDNFSTIQVERGCLAKHGWNEGIGYDII